MNFAERLKELRIETDMSQKELAAVLALSDRVISYYESNQRFPNDPAVLVKIANYFNVSLDYLLGASPFRTWTAPDSAITMSNELVKIVACYASVGPLKKGRILQFAIDMKDLEDRQKEKQRQIPPSST